MAAHSECPSSFPHSGNQLAPYRPFEQILFERMLCNARLDEIWERDNTKIDWDELGADLDNNPGFNESLNCYGIQNDPDGSLWHELMAQARVVLGDQNVRYMNFAYDRKITFGELERLDEEGLEPAHQQLAWLRAEMASQLNWSLVVDAYLSSGHSEEEQGLSLRQEISHALYAIQGEMLMDGGINSILKNIKDLTAIRTMLVDQGFMHSPGEKRDEDSRQTSNCFQRLALWEDETTSAIAMIDKKLPRHDWLIDQIYKGTRQLENFMRLVGINEDTRPELPTELIEVLEQALARVTAEFDMADREYIANLQHPATQIIGHEYLRRATQAVDTMAEAERMLNELPPQLRDGLQHLTFQREAKKKAAPADETQPGNVDAVYYRVGQYIPERNESQISTLDQLLEDKLYNLALSRRTLPIPYETAQLLTKYETQRGIEDAIAHEGTHYAVAYTIDIATLRAWHAVVTQEKVAVTPYVAKHQAETKFEPLVIEEDLCETSMLFLNDPGALFTKAPERFKFFMSLLANWYDTETIATLESLRTNNTLPDTDQLDRIFLDAHKKAFG